MKRAVLWIVMVLSLLFTGCKTSAESGNGQINIEQNSREYESASVVEFEVLPEDESVKSMDESNPMWTASRESRFFSQVYDGDVLLSEYNWEYVDYDNARRALVTEMRCGNEKIKLEYIYYNVNETVYVNSIDVDGEVFTYTVFNYLGYKNMRTAYKSFLYRNQEYEFLYDGEYISGIALNGEAIVRYTYMDSEGNPAVGVYEKMPDGGWKLNNNPDFIGNKNKVRGSSNYGVFDDVANLIFSPSNRQFFRQTEDSFIGVQGMDGKLDIGKYDIGARNTIDLYLQDDNIGQVFYSQEYFEKEISNQFADAPDFYIRPTLELHHERDRYTNFSYYGTDEPVIETLGYNLIYEGDDFRVIINEESEIAVEKNGHSYNIEAEQFFPDSWFGKRVHYYCVWVEGDTGNLKIICEESGLDITIDSDDIAESANADETVFRPDIIFDEEAVATKWYLEDMVAKRKAFSPEFDICLVAYEGKEKKALYNRERDILVYSCAYRQLRVFGDTGYIDISASSNFNDEYFGMNFVDVTGDGRDELVICKYWPDNTFLYVIDTLNFQVINDFSNNIYADNLGIRCDVVGYGNHEGNTCAKLEFYLENGKPVEAWIPVYADEDAVVDTQSIDFGIWTNNTVNSVYSVYQDEFDEEGFFSGIHVYGYCGIRTENRFRVLSNLHMELRTKYNPQSGRIELYDVYYVQVVPNKPADWGTFVGPLLYSWE